MDGLSETLRNLAITKRLNFLIGSGASAPAISLMSQIEVGTDEINDGESEELFKNDKLIKEVEKVSGELLNPEETDTPDINPKIQKKLEEYKNLIEVIS